MNQLTTSSKIYANALIDLGTFDETLKDLNTISEICDNSKDLVQVLENPTIALETKYELIDDVFSKDVNEKTRNFLKVLVEKKRFNEFEKIKDAYLADLDEIKRIKRVDVISAVDLSDTKKQEIIEKLQTKLQKDIIANWYTDKTIIAGLVIKIDDNVIDTSICNKLKKLSKNIEV